jgi:hypothetical protein
LEEGGVTDMGYYTSYEMQIDKADLGKAVDNALVEMFNGYSYIEYNGGGSWYANDRVKWYEHEEDIKGISEMFPDVLFTLDGEGEDSGDVWRKWFKNGTKIGEWYLVFNRPTFPAGYVP